MGNQFISFRLRNEEVTLLMQQTDIEENPSLTAQRIIRQVLGTEEIAPDRLTSLLTQVSEFQEKVNSVKSFVDETINERLKAVDRVVNEAVNQQMLVEEQRMRSRFDKFEQRLDKYFQILRASGTLPTPKLQQSDLPTEPLNQSELAKRLINPSTELPYSQSFISRKKDRKDFSEWSKAHDPQGVAWEFEPNDGLFYPLYS
jgi:hypothetical protein